MSIISDIKANFGSSSIPTDFIIDGYPDNADTLSIEIYGVLETIADQQNAVAEKPLERSQFTSDSKQIKPYIITIRGVLLPLNELLINTYDDLEAFITDSIEQLRILTNGVQLFSLSNLYSFSTYEPLTLFGIKTVTNSEMPIPEVVLSFKQVQSTDAVVYSTTAISPNQAQPQNKPNI